MQLFIIDSLICVNDLSVLHTYTHSFEMMINKYIVVVHSVHDAFQHSSELLSTSSTTLSESVLIALTLFAGMSGGNLSVLISNAVPFRRLALNEMLALFS